MIPTGRRSGDGVLELVVLIVQTSPSLRFPNLHPALLTLPTVRLADFVFPSQLCDPPPRLVFLQNPYDLLLAESSSFMATSSLVAIAAT